MFPPFAASSQKILQHSRPSLSAERGSLPDLYNLQLRRCEGELGRGNNVSSSLLREGPGWKSEATCSSAAAGCF